MKNTTKVKIVSGKRGWILTVGKKYIRVHERGFIMAIECENGIPYGASEFVSIQALRRFWHSCMNLIVDSTARPYLSVWGSFVKKETNYGYANGWSADTAIEVQKIENECQKLQHVKTVTQVDRCVKKYECETCGYVYYVDSSD